MAEPTAPPVLPPDAGARLADFARACKAAARAVSLYPAAHPAIGTTLGRLSQVTAMLTANGPYRLQVMGFGGSEGLKELVPLLADTEPLVQREAVQALVLNGSDEASRILLQAITSASGRSRETLLTELTGTRDERAAPLFCYLVRNMDRRKEQELYTSSVTALGAFGGGRTRSAAGGIVERSTGRESGGAERAVEEHLISHV
jgi:hypothetical protein